MANWPDRPYDSIKEAKEQKDYCNCTYTLYGTNFYANEYFLEVFMIMINDM